MEDQETNEAPHWDQNFCRVFELPESYSDKFCPPEGITTLFNMVDWFQPWPPCPMNPCKLMQGTWSDVSKRLIAFVKKKVYVQPGRQYIIITEFDKVLMFTGPKEGES